MNYIIVIAHQKGGVGKSTIASNLAVELSKRFDTSVIDLDMQKSLSYFNSVRSPEKRFNVSSINNFEELQRIINYNKNLLIIDVGGFDSDLNRAAILGADIVITPVSDSSIELIGLLAFKNILKDIRKIHPNLHANILMNRVHFKVSKSIDDIKNFVTENQEFKLLNTVVRDRAEFKKAFEKGISVNELDNNNKASIEINELISEILNGKN